MALGVRVDCADGILADAKCCCHLGCGWGYQLVLVFSFKPKDLGLMLFP